MGAKVERITKDILGRSALAVEQISPALLERCYGSLALFLNIPLLEKVHVKPFESLSNLRFAIRTILEAKGEVASENEITRLAQETTRNFFVSVIEVLNILYKDSWPKFVEPEISDEVKAFLRQKGIIASFHSGNPLVAAPFLKEILTQGSDSSKKKVAAFMEKQPAIIQNRLIPFVESFGVEPIFMDEEPTEILEKVRGTDFLITLFDRPPKERKGAVEVTFFGKSALFLKGPALLSLSLKRPIVPVVIVKADQGCYTAEIGNIVSPEDYWEIKNIKEKEREITQAVVAELEPIIARHPTSF